MKSNEKKDSQQVNHNDAGRSTTAENSDKKSDVIDVVGIENYAETEEIDEDNFKENYQFFDVRYKEADNIKVVRGLKINFIRFFSVLEKLGFRRIDIDKSHYLVHIENNIIREVDIIYMQDCFLKHILKIPLVIMVGEFKIFRNMIINHVFDNLAKYFDKEKLFRLALLDSTMINSDTKNECFFYYKNKCVKVTKDNIDLIDYSALQDKIIWDNNILRRDITLIDNWDEMDWINKNIWQQFLYNVCGEDPQRLVSLMSIIGYLMHKYFEGKLKGIVLTDSRVSDNPEGRTGKGLIFKGIGQMMNADTDFDKVYCEINGKQFNPENERKYESCEISTKLIHLDDVKPNYNVEVHYVELISGITVKQLYKSPVKIHVKIGISTNRTIRIQGGSSTDRFIIFDLADHYNDKFSPEDEFGKWFFRDFTHDEWNLFDTFMLECVRTYFNVGIKIYKSINMQQRLLHEQVGEELVNFLQDFPNQKLDALWQEEGIVPDRKYIKKDLYRLFIELSGVDEKKYSQKRFTEKLRLYKDFSEDWQKDFQDKKDGKYLQENRSSGNDLIWFVKAKK